jgi:hypothetical protein
MGVKMERVSKESAEKMFEQLLSNILEREAEGIFLCPSDRIIEYFDPGYNVDHREVDPGPTLSLEAYHALTAYIKDRWKIDPTPESVNFEDSFAHYDKDGEHLFFIMFLKNQEGEGLNIRCVNLE